MNRIPLRMRCWDHREHLANHNAQDNAVCKVGLRWKYDIAALNCGSAPGVVIWMDIHWNGFNKYDEVILHIFSMYIYVCNNLLHVFLEQRCSRQDHGANVGSALWDVQLQMSGIAVMLMPAIIVRHGPVPVQWRSISSPSIVTSTTAADGAHSK